MVSFVAFWFVATADVEAYRERFREILRDRGRTQDDDLTVIVADIFGDALGCTL